MTWETFWLPNIIQATLFAALAAIVGLLVRRYVGGLRVMVEQVLGWQQRGVEAAESAEKHSADSAAQSKKAALEAETSKNVALALKDQQGRIVEWLPEGDEAVEYLKETNSRLVAQLVIQATKHPEDFASPGAPRFIVPSDVPGEDGPATVTGRHRLHSPETVRLRTLDEREYE